jgi:Spherulation-specific family 4
VGLDVTIKTYSHRYGAFSTGLWFVAPYVTGSTRPCRAGVATVVLLGVPPWDEPHSWPDAVAQGDATVAVLARPTVARPGAAHAITTVNAITAANAVTAAHAITAANSIGTGMGAADPSGRPVAQLARAAFRLADAGVAALGLVRLDYGVRAMAQVRADIAGWASLPVVGVFLDEAPAGPFQLGPAVVATRAARHRGLATVVLNPGVPVDPAYRQLDATVCSFAGSWRAYRAWDGHGSRPGDGHLVHDVPQAEAEQAWDLITRRRAGLAMVSSTGWPYPT